MTYNDLIGTIGVGLILFAYVLATLKFIKSDKSLFFVLNIIGAGLACYASLLINYWPFVVLESAWVAVSIFGFFKNIRKN